MFTHTGLGRCDERTRSLRDDFKDVDDLFSSRHLGVIFLTFHRFVSCAPAIHHDEEGIRAYESYCISYDNTYSITV